MNERTTSTPFTKGKIKRAQNFSDLRWFIILIFTKVLGGCSSHQMVKSEKLQNPPLDFDQNRGRVLASDTISSSLAELNNQQLAEFLQKAEPLSKGINSETAKGTFGDKALFIKKVPLTAEEMKPENVKSSANIFNLPLFYQYGVGSTGFSAWRELAIHIKTTQWVLAGDCPHFPILYHWRIMPRKAPTGLSEQAKETIAKHQKHWANSSEIATKAQAAELASSELVLILEFIPHTFKKWLKKQASANWLDIELLERFHQEMISAVHFMNSQGVYHFDTHTDNFLTDGQTVFLTDFGLASDLSFDLSNAEREFIQLHENYDLALAMTALCTNLLKTDLDKSTFSNDKLLKEYLLGQRQSSLPKAARLILARWGKTAAVMQIFLQSIYKDKTKSIPFPKSDLEIAIKSELAENLQ